MAWIKRNLFFVIGGVLALGLLGAAGFYNFNSWRHNAAAFADLNDTYNKLRELNIQNPSPGNEQVNNVQAARDQERQLRDWMQQAETYFEPVPSIPDSASAGMASEAFASALHRTVDQLQHAAAGANVALPPQYMFSFKAESSLVKFAPGSLVSLAVQLGEVKSICDIFYAAKVNSFDGIQRERVSDDDANGPQSDYLADHSVTTDLAVITPYVVTFRCFGPELAKVMAGFAASHHGFVVKGINVEPAGAAGPGASPITGPAGAGAPPSAAFPPPAAARGGLQIMLDEQLLRVTLAIEIVKLSHK